MAVACDITILFEAGEGRLGYETNIPYAHSGTLGTRSPTPGIPQTRATFLNIILRWDMKNMFVEACVERDRVSVVWEKGVELG